MPPLSSVNKVAFLGDYPPRQCGIATFTRDLRNAVVAANPAWSCPVIAVSDRAGTYNYPSEVRFEIPQPDVASYVRAANFLNLAHMDVLCVQHEFGIFGGSAGSHLLALLRRVRMPVVTYPPHRVGKSGPQPTPRLPRTGRPFLPSRGHGGARPRYAHQSLRGR
jgi:hypothetical protein